MTTEMKQQLVPGQPVLVRSNPCDAWHYDIFSHIRDANTILPPIEGTVYVCVSGLQCCCIPYEGNEHLVGTTHDPELSKNTPKAGDEVPLMRPDYVEQHKRLVDRIIREPVAPKPVCGCSAKAHGLKPCPWCGEAADLHVIYKGTAPSKVQCQRCWRTVEAAVNGIEAWNDLPRIGDMND